MWIFSNKILKSNRNISNFINFFCFSLLLFRFSSIFNINQCFSSFFYWFPSNENVFLELSSTLHKIFINNLQSSSTFFSFPMIHFIFFLFFINFLSIFIDILWILMLFFNHYQPNINISSMIMKIYQYFFWHNLFRIFCKFHHFSLKFLDS